MNYEYVCPICGSTLAVGGAEGEDEDEATDAARKGTFDRWVAEHEEAHVG